MKFLIVTASVLVFLIGCTSHYASGRGEEHRIDRVLGELRMEVADLKHTLNAFHVEQAIAEEKIKNQEVTIAALKKQQLNGSKLPSKWEDQCRLLERELSDLKSSQQKILVDLKRLSEHANQTSSSLSLYKEKIQDCTERLNQLSQLKGTLDSITKAIKQPAASKKNYTVQPNDSLEKIARQHGTSVAALKVANQLQNDIIFPGQEIKIPYESH